MIIYSQKAGQMNFSKFDIKKLNINASKIKNTSKANKVSDNDNTGYSPILFIKNWCVAK